MVVSDTLSAQALLELLVSEGVPARIDSDTALFGVARTCRILVPDESLHRAKRVLSEAQFTDAELTFLATGETDRDAEGK